MAVVGTLTLLPIDGKLYLQETAWPEAVQVTRELIKSADPRRTAWNGQSFKLWLENGNAVYTLAPEDDGKGDVLTLHRQVASDVGEVPGRPLPEPAAPEPIVVSTSALEAVGFQRVTPPVDRIITAKNLPPPLATGPVASPFTSDFGTHKRTFLASAIFARALSDAQGMGGNASGYGNVRYFTSQDTIPVTPYRDLHHLQQEVDTMRAKLVSALEMQHTQYLMESPASAALALDSSASRWRTFLTDIGGYLNFVQGICQKLATMSYKNAQGEESRVWLTEPLAAQGRLSEFERSYQSERQPKEVTLKEMMGEMGRAAEMLGGQATSLLGIVAPSPLREKGSTPTPQDASEAEDANVLAEVDALTAMIGEQRYPGEWPVQSTSAAAFVRQEAWEKWAKDEARDCLVGDHSIDVAPDDKVVLGATGGNVQLEIFEVDRGNSTGHSFVAFDRAKDAPLASTLDVDERAFSDIEKAIAAKAPDVPYERNWDDPGNGGNGQMGGDDGG
jgi:hypothetical protein